MENVKERINVDGHVYILEDSVRLQDLGDGEDVQSLGMNIVVLQRGWVVVGQLYKNGNYFKLTNGYVVRKWGTTSGIGELADNGPLPDTKLDKVPDTSFHELTTIFITKCNEDKWNE